MDSNGNDIIYLINGRIYRFTNIRNDGGVPFGYCSKLRKKGWLYPNFIQFEGENGVVLATLKA